MRLWTLATAEQVARPLFSYLRRHGRWSGSPSELLELLQAETGDRSKFWMLPDDVDELAGVLNFLRRDLLRHGFGYKPNPFTGSDRIAIYKMSDANRAATRRSKQAYRRRQQTVGRRGWA